jgi:glycosyltransferase involved in cell wall biosynthesis
MVSTKKISVLMAVYNGEKFLKEAVDSILNQTLEDFEFFIVNDASTDSTSELLSQITDSRVTVINNETNKGLTYSLNLMLSRSCGKYIARMDSDDISLPHRFQTQYDYLESHPEIGICGSFVEAFYADGKKKIVEFGKDDTNIRAFAFFQSPFCHPSVMIRKDVLDNNSLQYPLQYRIGQDYALWIKLLEVTRGVNLPCVLLRFRKHEESVSILATNDENRRIDMINSIHRQYIERYGIHFSDDDLRLYTMFADRSVFFDFAKFGQKKISKLLRFVFEQIKEEHGYLQLSWQYHFSHVCFYKFFIAKKIPAVFFLQKSYFKGALFYVKRIIKKQLGV